LIAAQAGRRVWSTPPPPRRLAGLAERWCVMAAKSVLEALHGLWHLYSQTLLSVNADRQIPLGADEEGAVKAWGEARREIEHAKKDWHIAKQDLLKTGFSVPDHWMTVPYPQGVGLHYEKNIEDWVLEFSGLTPALTKRISQVCGEIGVVCLRIEAGSEADLEIGPPKAADRVVRADKIEESSGDGKPGLPDDPRVVALIDAVRAEQRKPSDPPKGINDIAREIVAKAGILDDQAKREVDRITRGRRRWEHQDRGDS